MKKKQWLTFRNYGKNRKLLRAMKLTLIFLIAGLMQVSATVYSQATTFTLKLNEVRVVDVLRDIEEQSDFRFFYQREQVDVERKVNLNVSNLTVEQILDQLFSEHEIEFNVRQDNLILLKPKSTAEQAVMLNRNQQEDQTITGTIKDQSGLSIPGATVMVKGTTIGTITDMDGNFTLTGVPEGATLLFSFVGMKNVEIPAAGKTTFNIVLQEESIDLDEVVAIGYGTMRKSDLTGALSSVSSKSLNETPISRIDQGLQGKAAGVQITNTDGAPGGNVKIRIRGANSISGDNSPLIVIDGFLGGNISNLNPADIESVEILKDASSTAIYGSRGANGVVLVTTKIGKQGKTKVSYNTFFSSQNLRRKLPLLSAPDYARVANERSTSQGGSAVYTDAEIQNFEANGGTDWQDEIFRTGLHQNHNLSISGGNEKTRFLISGNYVNQEGILLNSGYKRYQLRGNLENEINKKVKVGLRFFGIREVSQPQYFNAFQGTPVTDALRFPATVQSVYDENGNYMQLSDPQLWNPVASALSVDRDLIMNTFNANAFVDYKMVEGLTLRLSAGSEIVTTDDNAFRSADNRETQAQNGQISLVNAENLTWINTNNLTYDKSYDNNNRLNVTLVYEQQYNKFTRSVSGAQDFVTDVLGYNGISLGNTTLKPNAFETERVMQSFLGRINFALGDKLNTTLSGRYDGSSVLAPGKKWDFFPSAAVAWRISEYPFLSKIDAISSAKVRASYGFTGSQAVSPYSSFAALRSGQDYALNGQTPEVGIGLDRYPNTNLGWEKTSQLDFGLDLHFFSGRLGLAADYYKKKTTDLLLYVPYPFYTGLPTGTNPPSLLENVGEMENQGLEFSVNAMPVHNDNVTWDMTLNLSTNKSKVLDLGGKDFIFGGNFGGTSQPPLYIIRKGKPLGDMYGLKYMGVWKSNEATEAAKYGAVPGDPRHKDLDGNFVINEEDKEVIGNGTPKTTWGLTSNLTYKNFDLNIFVNGAHGYDIYNYTRMLTLEMNNHPDLLNAWTPQNEDTDVQSIASMSTSRQNTSKYVEDASYVRLKNIALGYKLPTSFLSKVRIDNARFYVSAQNVWTITDYSGYDPEINSAGGSDRDLGLDMGGYPPAKVYTIGLELNF